MEDDDDKPAWESDLSCTFCGPGTQASWDVVTEDGVSFVCDRHHVEMSEAKIIRLERKMGKKNWREIRDFKDFKDLSDYE